MTGTATSISVKTPNLKKPIYQAPELLPQNTFLNYALMQRDSPTMSGKSPNLNNSTYQARESTSENSAFKNKIDIWAFSCVLFEMATQRAAFCREEEIRRLKMGMGSTITFHFDYRGVNEKTLTAAMWTETLVQKTMTVDPEERPSAGWVLETIEAFLRRRRSRKVDVDI